MPAAAVSARFAPLNAARAASGSPLDEPPREIAWLEAAS